MNVTQYPTSQNNWAIYIIKSSMAVKIGIAKDVDRRLASLQVGCWEKLWIDEAYWVPGESLARKAENLVHKRLEARRAIGEWFFIKPHEAAEFIRGVLCSLGCELDGYVTELHDHILASID